MSRKIGNGHLRKDEYCEMLINMINVSGGGGTAVAYLVEAICYKRESRGSDS
jgi:hypothetical protein